MGLLALFFSIIFSSWFLIRDIRRRKAVSPAIWIPTILLIIIGSRSLSEWFGVAGNIQVTELRNNAPRSLLDEMFYLSVLLSAPIIASFRGVKWNKLFSNNLILMALYLFFAISILWSDDPFGSFKRIAKDFGMLFVIALILSEKDPLEAIQAIYFRCASVLFPLSVVFIRYFPSLGRNYTNAGEPMAIGVTTQKNSLGEIVLVFGLILVWDCLEPYPEKKTKKLPWDRLTLLFIGALLLYDSQSKTSLVCFLLGLAIILRNGLLTSKVVHKMVLGAALSMPVLLFSVEQFGTVIKPILEALGRDTTFTGRTDIWDHITAGTVNPILGAGYWNFWGGRGGLAIMQDMQTPIPNAHCGYLDIYLDGGWAALTLLFFLLIVSGNRLIRDIQSNRFQYVRFAFLIVAIIYNLFESSFIRLGPLWFTTLLAIVNFPLRESAVEVGENASVAIAGNLPSAKISRQIDFKPHA